MIKIYVSPSCSSCKKVKKWFEEQKIPYEERSIFSPNLNEGELKDILVKTETGANEIISKRSKVIKDKKVDVDNMTITEMIAFIRENPTVLKRPIVVDDKRIQVGYNKDEITTFIPKTQLFKQLQCDSCETTKDKD